MDAEPTRLFTLEEANALLPTLRTLLEDLEGARQRLLQTASALEALEAQRDRDNVLRLARPLREARERLGSDREALRLAFTHITDLGVQIKRLRPALLDFPAQREGQTVLLCWQEGEPSVAYWHLAESGFAGRRPLP